jgi:hypothetical protein
MRINFKLRRWTEERTGFMSARTVCKSTKKAEKFDPTRNEPEIAR